MNSRWASTYRAIARLVLAGVAALAIEGTAAAAPPPNRAVNDTTGDPSFGTQCNPVIRSLGDKVVAVWSDGQTASLLASEQRMQYAVSTDSGATFTDLGAVPAPTTPVTWRWRNDAQLGVDPVSGAFYAAGQIQSTATATRMGVAIVRGTFIGPTFTWGTPVVVRDFSGASPVRFPILAFEVEPQTGDLHLLYCNYYGGATGQVETQRSTDDGATWSAPLVLSSGVDVGAVSSPRLATGIDGDMHAAWLGRTSLPNHPIRYVPFSGTTATWSGEEAAVVAIINPLAPGLQGAISGFGVMHRFSLAVNRTSGANTRGRVAIAWSESWVFGGDPFPPLELTPFVLEVENNDNAASANPFTLGQVIRGASSKPNDADYWKLSLAAGQAIVAWPDSVASTSTTIPITIYGPDGSTLHGSMYTIDKSFVYHAPVAGVYYIRIDPSDNTTYYRVRTRTSSGGSGEARDQRDIAVIYRQPGSLGWTAPVRLTDSPVGYDDHLPEIGWGADGLDYLTWYDFGIAPTGSRSHLVVARNLLGNDPVPSVRQVVTTQPSRWDSISFLLSLGTGHWNSVSADDRRVHLGWADLRFANSNVMATTLATGVVPGACPGSASGAPNTTVAFQIPLMNRNPLFEEKCLITVTGSRNWPVMNVRDSVPAGTAGALDIAVAIPDTAAPGVNTLAVTVKRQSGLVVTTCNVPLTVANATGVEDGAIAFAMHAPFPNPAQGSVKLGYALPSAGHVRVEILGLRGERVRTLVDGLRPAGAGSVAWDTRDDGGRRVAAGFYFARLAAGGRMVTGRVLVVR